MQARTTYVVENMPETSKHIRGRGDGEECMVTLILRGAPVYTLCCT